MEDHKVPKIRMQWMLRNTADIKNREVKPLLRTNRKFKAQDEIDYFIFSQVFINAVDKVWQL